MIIDTTLSAMEKRMDGFRCLDEAVERKKHRKEDFEKRIRVMNLFSVGRNIQKSRELLESSRS